MKEQNISKEEVLDLYYKLPQWRGELYKFRNALTNEEF